MAAPLRVHEKPSILTRINLATTLAIVPLLVVVAVQVTQVRQIEHIREQVIERELPNVLGAMSMSERLQRMNGNLLEYVLGARRGQWSFHKHHGELKALLQSLETDQLDGHTRDTLPKLIESIATEADAHVFSFDASLTETLATQVSQVLNSQVVHLEQVLDGAVSETSAALTEQDKAHGVALALQVETLRALAAMRSHLAAAANGLTLLAARQPSAAGKFVIHTHEFQLELDSLRAAPEGLPGSAVRVKEIERLFALFLGAGEALLEHFDVESYHDAMLTIEDVHSHAIAEAEGVLAEHAVQSREGMEQALEHMRTSARRVETINHTAIGFTIAVTLLYLGYLRRHVVQPVHGLSQAINHLRDGRRDLDFANPLQARELASIQDNLVNFQHELNELDRLRTEQLDRVQQQHLEALEAANAELRQSLEEREATTAKLERANSDLAQFVHIASHDLREPVKKLGILCQTLEEELGDRTCDSSRQLLPMISSNARSLSALITDLGALAELENVLLTSEETDLSALVHEVLNSHAGALEGRLTAFDIGALPTMTVHPSLLRQVFDNLVRNAIVHCEGMLQLSIHATPSEYGWEFAVGNPVAADANRSQRLLSPFVRGQRARPGTGMGLANCKRVIELHGGEIRIDQTQQARFVVHFTIPHEIPTRPSQGHATDPTKEAT